MASAGKNSKSNGSSLKKASRNLFVLCLRNDGYAASLEPRKIYALVQDATAARHKLVRVIDESGEAYLYPADYFIALRLPSSVKTALCPEG
jgi:hypothetical protein